MISMDIKSNFLIAQGIVRHSLIGQNIEKHFLINLDKKRRISLLVCAQYTCSETMLTRQHTV